MTDKLSMALDDIIKKETKKGRGSTAGAARRGSKNQKRENSTNTGASTTKRTPGPSTRGRARQTGRSGRVEKARHSLNNNNNNNSNKPRGQSPRHQLNKPNRKPRTPTHHPRTPLANSSLKRENYEITIINDRMNRAIPHNMSDKYHQRGPRAAPPPMVATGDGLDLYEMNRGAHGVGRGPSLERYRAPPSTMTTTPGFYSDRGRGRLPPTGRTMEDVTFTNMTSSTIRKP